MMRAVQRCVGSDVIYTERRGQSQKPEEIYQLIEELVPAGDHLAPAASESSAFAHSLIKFLSSSCLNAAALHVCSLSAECACGSCLKSVTSVSIVFKKTAPLATAHGIFSLD